MSKYQEALDNLIINSCPVAIRSKEPCSSCKINKTCNALAKGCIDTLQELIDKDKEKKMNKEERVKLVFETISKIAGFEITPDTEFYIVENCKKDVYRISENLNLLNKKLDGCFYEVEYNILPIFRGGYQLEEFKESLLTNEEKEFLRQFRFETLSVSDLLYLYSKNGLLVAAISLNKINVSFDKLIENSLYSRGKLGL